MAVDVIIDPLTGQIYWNDSQNTAQSIAISGNGSDLIKLIGYSLQFAGAPSGTLSAADNTTTITGSGTNFTTLFGSGAAANGAILYTIQGTSIGIVSSVTNDTTLVLQSNASGNYNNISFRIAPPSGTDRIIFSDSSTPLKPATTGSGLGDATYRWSLYASDINASGNVTLTNALGIAYGGTGQTTSTSAINALLPSQTSNDGKYLTTNGSNVSWATISSSGSGTVGPGTTNQLAYYSGTTTTASAAGLTYNVASSFLTISRNDSTTNTIADLLYLQRTTTGTAASGIGGGIQFDFENSDGNIVTAGQVDGILSAVGASYSGNLIFYTNQNGTNTTGERLRITRDGISINSAQTGHPLSVSPRDSGNEPSSTNTVLNAIVIDRTTSGLAASGIGGRLLYQLENNVGNRVSAASIDGILSNANFLSYVGALVFNTNDTATNTLSERLRVDNSAVAVTGKLTANESIFTSNATTKIPLKIIGTTNQSVALFNVSNITGTTLFEVNNTGIVTSGTWNAKIIDINYGGTNTSSYSTTNSIIYFDGSKFVNTNTLASAILVTDVSKVPSLAVDIPSGITIGSKYIYRADDTDVALADGGTNASLTAVAGGVVYSTSTAFAITSQGTSGQALRSGGTGAPTFGTLGIFGGGTGLSSIGGSNSVLGVNNAASALEYKSLVGTNISVDHSPSTVTFTCNNVTTGNNGQVVIYNGTSTVGPGPGLDYNSGTSGFEWIFYLYNPNKTALKVMGTSSQVAPIFDVSTISTTVFEINNVGNISKGTWNASTIGVLYGGTGTTSFSSNSVIIESGGILSSITGTNNQILTIESGIPKYFSISGDLTSSTPGNITIANGAVTSDRIGNNAVSFSKLPAASGASIIGAPFSSSTVFQAVTATTSGNVLRMSGTAIGFGALDLSSSNAVSNQLSILNGGTGQSTATSAINALLPSQSSNNGKYLTTDGINVSWGTVTAGGGSGTVSSGTINEVAYYSGASTTASASGLVYSASSQHLQITSQGPTISPLKLVGASGQSASLFNVSSNTATVFEINASGVVSTGTWNGSIIGVAYGGIGTSTTPNNGQIPIGNGTRYEPSYITASSGITVTNGSGSITLKSPRVLNFIMAASYNPPVGADTAVFRIPEDPINGTSAVNYNLRNFFVRVETPSAGTSQIKLERSTGSGAFSTSPTQLLSNGGSGVTLVSSNAIQVSGTTSYEFYTTAFATTVVTGDKIRLNFSAVDLTHANFNINLLLEEA